MSKRKGPTPSRASRERQRRSESRPKHVSVVRVVRVRCDGCGEVVFNPHATGDDRRGEPMYVARCQCGAETATFHDVALAPEGMYPVAA